MARLTDDDRKYVWSSFMKKLGRDSISIDKAALRDAVNSIDQFLEDNAAAINSAFPQPAKSELTNSQKAQILSFVALKRFGVERDV